MPVEIHKASIDNIVIHANKNDLVVVKIQPTFLFFIAGNIQSPLFSGAANS